jgi:hypothetical protein
LLIASSVTPPSVGGPLLDEYGNYVGILGGSIFPGGDPIRSLSLLSEASASSRTFEWEETGMAVPQTILPDVPATAAATSLTDLAARGEMLSPVIKIKALQSATLGIMGSGNSLGVYKRVFSRQDKKPVAQISWQGLQKEKFSCVYRLFNVDNKLVAESKPRDISLNSGKYMTTTWEIPVASIPAGIYRVDLVLSGRTAWREFLKVTD